MIFILKSNSESKIFAQVINISLAIITRQSAKSTAARINWGKKWSFTFVTISDGMHMLILCVLRSHQDCTFLSYSNVLVVSDDLLCFYESVIRSVLEYGSVVWQSPTKSYTLDPIPTFLVKEMVDVMLPYVTAMINTSLREGRLPSSHKHAVVTPLLKKPGLDAEELKNYRPGSNLTFVSKLMERVVSSRLVSYLTTHGQMPQLQSAYRRHQALRQHCWKCCLTSMLQSTVSKWQCWNCWTLVQRLTV